MLVSNRHDEDVVLPNAVDDREREPRDESLPVLLAEGRARDGSSREAFDGVLDRGHKPDPQPGESFVVEDGRRIKLHLRFGVERDDPHRSFARA